MISIINYGMGNIRSIQNALAFIEVKSRVIATPEELLASTALILPGVGSFKQAMKNIRDRGLEKALQEVVGIKKIPILGICLGMQLLAESGDEDGPSQGLSWIGGRVTKFHFPDQTLKIPHIGFNTASFDSNNVLFKGLAGKADFYFVHSYRLVPSKSAEVSSYTHYGEDFVSSVQKDHIFGTQFHPEKSQSNGLIVLKNFVEAVC